MQFSFKIENAKLLRGLWTAPPVRILSQETTRQLPGTPACLGSRLGLVGIILQGRGPACRRLLLLQLWAPETGLDSLQTTGQVSVYLLKLCAFMILN